MQPQDYAFAIVNDLFDEFLDPDLFEDPESDEGDEAPGQNFDDTGRAAQDV